jgi:hypothetical protein
VTRTLGERFEDEGRGKPPADVVTAQPARSTTTVVPGTISSTMTGIPRGYRLTAAPLAAIIRIGS